jgi:hypothetical protein
MGHVKPYRRHDGVWVDENSRPIPAPTTKTMTAMFLGAVIFTLILIAVLT